MNQLKLTLAIVALLLSGLFGGVAPAAAADSTGGQLQGQGTTAIYLPGCLYHRGC